MGLMLSSPLPGEDEAPSMKVSRGCGSPLHGLGVEGFEVENFEGVDGCAHA